MGASRVLVVGAGVGGLVSAIELARRGFSVTVLERAEVAGGKVRVEAVGGRSVDAGPTVLTMRGVFDEVFAAAGARLDEHVTLRRAEVLARHAWTDGTTLDLYSDVDRSAEAVDRFAGPREAQGYRAFCAYAAKIHRAVEGPFLRAGRPTVATVLRSQGLMGVASLAQIDATRTMARALGDFFHDPRLLQLFGRYATYAGSSPFAAPATLNVIAHVERDGVWYVEGGMIALARALEALAQSLGAVVRTRCGVAELTEKSGRVGGVRLESGEEVPADAVVFNGDVRALTEGRLGRFAARAWGVGAGEPRSLSALTFAGLGRAEGFPLARHNVFFSSDYAREFKDIFEGDALPTEPTVYVCAQDRRDGGAPPFDGDERLLMIVNAPARGGRRPLSAEEVERCERRTRTLLHRCGLTVGWAPACKTVTTPDDFAQRFPGTGGALYGPPSHGWKSPVTRAGARSKLPGLYLTGGSTHPGAGVPMVALSGRLAAQAVTEDLASTSGCAPGAMRGGTSTH